VSNVTWQRCHLAVLIVIDEANGAGLLRSEHFVVPACSHETRDHVPCLVKATLLPRMVLVKQIREVGEAQQSHHAEENDQHGREDTKNDQQLKIELNKAGLRSAAVALCLRDIYHAEYCPDSVGDVPVAVDEEEAIVNRCVAG
jgi:hypothetical protein